MDHEMPALSQQQDLELQENCEVEVKTYTNKNYNSLNVDKEVTLSNLYQFDFQRKPIEECSR